MPLRNLDLVKIHVDFVQANYAQITSPAGLKNLLLQCFNNPALLSGDTRDNNVWLYEILISLLKAKSKRKQGYGLAQLADDTGLSESGGDLLRFIMPKFTQILEYPNDRVVDALSEGLSKRVSSNIKAHDLPVLRETVTDIVIKENLQDRLIPYRNFEPLIDLLIAALKKHKKPYSPKEPHVGWINEYAHVGKKSATTPFIRVQNTLIHWKSVSDSGKSHKKKELSARARNVKYEYNPSTKTFSRRDGVEKLALIVDGTFDDVDLKVLADSGWDIIVYPDEMDKLIAAIV